MDVERVIRELREDLERIDQAIAAMERLAKTVDTKRRGRPPKWLAEARKASTRTKKQRKRK